MLVTKDWAAMREFSGVLCPLLVAAGATAATLVAVAVTVTTAIAVMVTGRRGVACGLGHHLYRIQCAVDVDILDLGWGIFRGALTSLGFIWGRQ
jgi:cytolysin (calcineurin-like family phosphatase)